MIYSRAVILFTAYEYSLVSALLANGNNYMDFVAIRFPAVFAPSITHSRIISPPPLAKQAIRAHRRPDPAPQQASVTR